MAILLLMYHVDVKLELTEWMMCKENSIVTEEMNLDPIHDTRQTFFEIVAVEGLLMHV